MDELVQKYKTIGPLLGKIEGIIENSTTLRLPKMKSYYKFWERRFFNALNKVIVASFAIVVFTLRVDGAIQSIHLPKTAWLSQY